MVFFALFGTIFFLTQYLQSVLGYGPITAGAAFIPVSVGMIVASQVSARLTVRVGPRPIVAGGLALVGAGLALLSLAEADSGYGLIAAALAALGFGMGMAMTPATESLMSALPKEHAGVGSAMNDAVRQVGGALGVAVLGSLLSSGYRGDMETAVSGLPAEAGDAASEGVGGAVAVADKVGGQAGDSLAPTANEAFTSAMSTTVLVAAGAALIGSLLAAVLLPSKKHERRARDRSRPGRPRSQSRWPRERAGRSGAGRCAGAGAPAQRRVSRGDPAGDARAARRERHAGHVDGRGRGARRGVQGDDLPALEVEGGARRGAARPAARRRPADRHRRPARGPPGHDAPGRRVRRARRSR